MNAKLCLTAFALALSIAGCTGSPEAGYGYRMDERPIGYRPERQDEDYEGIGDERSGFRARIEDREFG